MIRKFFTLAVLMVFLLQSGLFINPTPIAHAVEIQDLLNQNVAVNPDFEIVNGNAPTGWITMGGIGWNTEKIKLTQETAHSGTYSVSIGTDKTEYPWVGQDMPVEPGATYELSAWLKSNYMPGNGALYKIEFLKDNTYLGGLSSPFAKESLTGDWQFNAFQVVLPADCNRVQIILRLFGPGKVFYDDVSFKMIKHAPMVNITTDQIFYYTDKTEGVINADLKPNDNVIDGKCVDMRIIKDSTGEIIKQELDLAAVKNLEFTFNPADMSVQEPYTVEISLKSSGVVLDTQKTTIYRWERPTALAKDGKYMVDGKPFFPVIGYHVNLSQPELLKKAGINTVQGMATYNENELRQFLDTAYENNIKVMVPLYIGMKVKENYENTRKMVTLFKDHPAVLTWMVMDEPSLHSGIYEELIGAYKIIRSIDPVHPTYIVECYEGYMQSTGKVTDILSVDPYPLPQKPITEVGDFVRSAKVGVNYDKPVWAILQAFRLQPTWPYLPTIDEIRHMVYQAVLEEASGVGYYSFTDPGWNLMDSELWPGLVNFREELGCISDLVVGSERINQFKSDKVQWAIWQKGSELYVAALNLTKDQQEVTIPLNINGYQAELLYGGEADSFGSLDSELPVQLADQQVKLYKVTPFSSFIEKAESVLNGARDIIDNQHWSVQLNQSIKNLQTIKEEVASVDPNMKKVVDDAANVLRDLDHLKEWTDKQENLDTRKNDLLAALNQAAELINNIVESLVKLDVQIDDIKVVSDQQVQVSVKVKNNGKQDITNASLTLQLPEVFGLENSIKPIFKIKHGEMIEETFEFTVQSNIPLGTYLATAEFDFSHHEISIQTSKSVAFEVIDLIAASLEPTEILTRSCGNYNVTLKMINNSTKPVDVTLESELPEGMGMDMSSQVTLSPEQSVDVNGILHIPVSTLEGSYTVYIQIKVDGRLIKSLPLKVRVDKNLIFNPGFELDANSNNIPDGWVMGKEKWVQDVVKNGRYAVTLLPDNKNTWNVIMNDSPKNIEVTPGASYRMKVWVKNSSTTGGVFVGIREIKSDYSSLKYTWKEALKNSDWTQYEITFTPSANTKYVAAYLRIDQFANGQAWFDDIFLEKLEVK